MTSVSTQSIIDTLRCPCDTGPIYGLYHTCSTSGCDTSGCVHCTMSINGLCVGCKVLSIFGKSTPIVPRAPLNKVSDNEISDVDSVSTDYCELVKVKPWNVVSDSEVSDDEEETLRTKVFHYDPKIEWLFVKRSELFITKIGTGILRYAGGLVYDKKLIKMIEQIDRSCIVTLYISYSKIRPLIKDINIK